jgi:hypothetical protein
MRQIVACKVIDLGISDRFSVIEKSQLQMSVNHAENIDMGMILSGEI